MKMDNSTTEVVYTFIEDFVRRCGHAPTQREIAAGCFLSQPSVHVHLKKLKAQGRLTSEPGKARTLTIIPR